MNLNYMFKPTERTKIQQEISMESNYNKDIEMYYNLGVADGFIMAMKFMSEADKSFIMEEIIKIHNNDKENKAWKYIIRLYKDKLNK